MFVKALASVPKPPPAKKPAAPVPPSTRVAEVIGQHVPSLLGVSDRSAVGKKVSAAVLQAVLTSINPKTMSPAKVEAV